MARCEADQNGNGDDQEYTDGYPRHRYFAFDGFSEELPIRKHDDQRDGQHAQKTDHSRERDRQRDITTPECGQQIRGHTSRRGRDDHNAECDFRGYRPDRHKYEPDQGQQNDLGNCTDEKILRLAGDTGEIADRQPESERKHYERERKWQKDVGYETRGSALSFDHKTDIPASLSTDIPQMTSKFAEIVPWPHLQGHSVPIAALR